MVVVLVVVVRGTGGGGTGINKKNKWHDRKSLDLSFDV